MMPFNDLATQQQRLRPQIDAAIARVLAHGQYIMGPEVGELEAALASRVGVRHCLTMASGTTALEIALRALGIGPGDEVITTPFTWIATANAIALVGAIPVFVDIRADASYLIDPALVAAAITPRTKAVLPVSLFGQMAELDLIAAAAPGIPIIEDAAQSFGATRHGRPSCSASLIACTSFFPTKPLGCYGDGGALFTDDDRIAELARAMRSHGGKQRHHHTCIGTNGRMDTLQAAITLAKLESFDAECVMRREVAATYDRLLGNRFDTPVILTGNTSVYAQYTIRPRPGEVWDRSRSIERLKAAGIPTSVYYPRCCHQQPAFAAIKPFGLLNRSESASLDVLSLPFSPWLDERQLREIAELVCA